MTTSEFTDYKLNLMYQCAIQGDKVCNAIKVGKRRDEISEMIYNLMCQVAMMKPVLHYHTLVVSDPNDEDDPGINMFSNKEMKDIEEQLNELQGTSIVLNWELET